MPKPRPNLLAFFALAALAGCGGGAPFVLTDYKSHQSGIVEVCYDDAKTSIADAQKLADGVCKLYERTADFQLAQRNQCTWRTPELALFYCVARPGETPPPFVPQKAPLRSPSTGG